MSEWNPFELTPYTHETKQGYFVGYWEYLYHGDKEVTSGVEVLTFVDGQFISEENVALPSGDKMYKFWMHIPHPTNPTSN